MDLVGKSPEQVEAALKGVARKRIIEAVKDLAAGEPFFTPEQVARLRQIPKAAVMERIKKTRQLRAHLIGNKWRVPLSALREWDKNTQVTG